MLSLTDFEKRIRWAVWGVWPPWNQFEGQTTFLGLGTCTLLLDHFKCGKNCQSIPSYDINKNNVLRNEIKLSKESKQKCVESNRLTPPYLVVNSGRKAIVFFTAAAVNAG